MAEIRSPSVRSARKHGKSPAEATLQQEDPRNQQDPWSGGLGKGKGDSGTYMSGPKGPVVSYGPQRGYNSGARSSASDEMSQQFLSGGWNGHVGNPTTSDPNLMGAVPGTMNDPAMMPNGNFSFPCGFGSFPQQQVPVPFGPGVSHGTPHQNPFGPCVLPPYQVPLPQMSEWFWQMMMMMMNGNLKGKGKGEAGPEERERRKIRGKKDQKRRTKLEAREEETPRPRVSPTTSFVHARHGGDRVISGYFSNPIHAEEETRPEF